MTSIKKLVMFLKRIIRSYDFFKKKGEKENEN